MRTISFKSYRNLKHGLGRADAIVECIEVSIRELVLRNQNSAGAALRDWSLRHQIKVDEIDTTGLPIRVAQLYILSVFQQFEDFLEAFRDEYPGSDSWDYNDEDLFSNIARNLFKQSAEKRPLHAALVDHYRTVRNKFMHTEIKDQRVNKHVAKLRERVKNDPLYSALNAPNPFNEISFDDFVLFSRTAKHAALWLCEAKLFTDEELVELFVSESMKLDARWKDKLKSNRAKATISTAFRCWFGIEIAIDDKIIDYILESLA